MTGYCKSHYDAALGHTEGAAAKSGVRSPSSSYLPFLGFNRFYVAVPKLLERRRT